MWQPAGKAGASSCGSARLSGAFFRVYFFAGTFMEIKHKNEPVRDSL